MNRKRWLALGGVVALLLVSLVLLGSRKHSLSPLVDYSGSFELNQVQFYQGPTQRWMVQTWVLDTKDMKAVGEVIEPRFPSDAGWQRVPYSNAVGLQKMVNGSLHEISYGRDDPGKVWVQEAREISSIDYLRQWVQTRGRVSYETAKADRKLGK